jgi:hypothetical protein
MKGAGKVRGEEGGGGGGGVAPGERGRQHQRLASGRTKAHARARKGGREGSAISEPCRLIGSKLGGSTLVAALSENEKIVVMHYCRMGHVAFDKISKVFPDVMSEVDKNNLKCEACEYAEHTRNTYVSKGLRSIPPSMFLHSNM